jgi:hypothetical protein
VQSGQNSSIQRTSIKLYRSAKVHLILRHLRF